MWQVFRRSKNLPTNFSVGRIFDGIFFDTEEVTRLIFPYRNCYRAYFSGKVTGYIFRLNVRRRILTPFFSDLEPPSWQHFRYRKIFGVYLDPAKLCYFFYFFLTINPNNMLVSVIFILISKKQQKVGRGGHKQTCTPQVASILNFYPCTAQV